VQKQAVVSARRKRERDEEDSHSSSERQAKRLDYGMYAPQNMTPDLSASTNDKYETKAINNWECARDDRIGISVIEANEDSARPGAIVEEIPQAAANGSHVIDDAMKQSLIDQLYFDKIDERVTHLTAAQRGTCRWFLAKPEYTSWLSVAQQPDHGGLFWIKGNPGTGKSTLMKFLFEEAKLSANKTSSQIILSFFFLARGTDDEKSATGLYRSLLHQLFQKIPETKKSLEWMTADGAKTVQRNRWQGASLKQTLARAVQEFGHGSLTIFVDALDECNQDQVADMVSFFEELCDRAREKQLLLRICFSSRHYPTVTVQQGVEVILEDENGHVDDIQQYIKSKLRMPKSNTSDSLRHEIFMKSSGIFLWVVLVLDILNHECSKSTKKMRDRLKEIPPRLNDLFQMILTRDSDNRDQLKACLKWILFASRPLKPPELYFAVQFKYDKECSGFWDREDIGPDEIKAFVRSSSEGLAEVTRNRATEVQFIHESVRDFLLGNYGEQWSEEPSNLTGHSHEFLKDCCLAQLMSQQIQLSKYLPKASQAAEFEGYLSESLPKASEATEMRSSINSEFPFLEYAVSNLFHHANAAQRNGIGQKNFLEKIQLQRWIFFNNALEKYDIRRYTESAKMLYIFSERNLPDLLSIHFEKNYFEVSDERYGTPIFAALANNSREVVEAFLKSQAQALPRESAFHELYKTYCQQKDIKASLGRNYVFLRKRGIFYHLLKDVDEIFMTIYLSSNKAKIYMSPVDNSGRTPLHYTIEKGYTAKTLALLTLDGIDVNVQDLSGNTPLSYASRMSNEAVVEALLAHNAINVNTQDKSGNAPLFYAIKSANIDVIQALLSHNAINVNILDASGNAPLFYAVRTGNEDVLKTLLAYDGIDINMQGHYGQTPLLQAIDTGHQNAAKLLLEYNANIELANNAGLTPLLQAAIHLNSTITGCHSWP
jgi:hypothetical protein